MNERAISITSIYIIEFIGHEQKVQRIKIL